MILLIGIVSVVLFIFCSIVIYCKGDDQDGDDGAFIGMQFFFFCLFVIEIIVGGVLLNKTQSYKLIDAKIELYQEQNQKIEDDLVILVDKYMEFENKTMENVSKESYITLIQMFPELKSNELIKTQIQIHIENNNKITTLKEEKINISIYRFWLYFGG